MTPSGTRKLRFLSWAIPVLVTGVGAYELWTCAALRDRPWQLEAMAGRLAAACDTAKGSRLFAKDLEDLAHEISDAGLALEAAHGTWVIRRDYTGSVQGLLQASLTALRIRMNEESRLREQRQRFRVFLGLLESELGAARTGAGGASIDIRNLAQSRARTLLDGARNLEALNQSESAMIAVLQARSAWKQNERFQAAELARFHDAQYRARWEQDARNLLRWTGRSGRPAILVDKLEHRCMVLVNGKVEKSYTANLGRNWYRDKVQEHDASTPEGEYRIKRKFLSPSFGWALLLDYPNAEDLKRFQALKKSGDVAARARIGGNIEIHGGGRQNLDWTDGCVSLENSAMAELYKRAYAGMPVTIVGTSSVGPSEKE